MFREDNRAGLGVVVGDHQGQVLASLSKNVPLPPSNDVEALAAARATILLLSWAFHQLS